MKRVVIAGASVFGLSNLSDDAMFTVFCRELHRNIPELEITLLARHPSPELDITYGLRSIPNLDHQSKEASLGRWFQGLNPGDSTDHLREIWDRLQESDLLVIGGEPFIDISLGLYRGPAPYAVLLMTLARFLNKPVMINGIHIGRSLSTETGRELTRYCVSNADLVTIREEQTRPILERIGIEDTSHIVTLSDPAYGLDPIPGSEKGRSILREEGISPQSDRLVGVTFRHMYWKWDGPTWERYSAKVADICDYLIETFGADVLFVPHDTYTAGDKYESDLPAHSDIVAKIRNAERVHQIRSRLSVEDTLALFPLFDMTFSNRRHTLIFSALHDTVGLGVGEELHVQVTMEELGIGEDMFIDIGRLDANTVKAHLQEIWQDRDAIRTRQRERVPALRQRALAHARLAAKLI